MKLQLFKLFLLPSVLFLTACSSVSENNGVTSGNNTIVALPIATAVQIDYQDEVKLLRLNQLIAEHQGEAKEKSMLLYERGLIYDRMGLSAHSRYDFTQAINTYPDFAEPYNSYGVYLLLSQSYDEAFDAFDSAIELSDTMHFSYLHRAIGLYQVKRYELASRDINKFYALDKSDPYRVLWRYIIDSNLNEEQALLLLRNEKVESGDNRYAWSLVDVIAGRTSENEFLASVTQGVKSNKELAERLCEAYFYLAHWHKQMGHLDKAIYYFKMTTTTNIHEFIEYKYALMELTAIQQSLQEKLAKQVN